MHIIAGCSFRDLECVGSCSSEVDFFKRTGCAGIAVSNCNRRFECFESLIRRFCCSILVNELNVCQRTVRRFNIFHLECECCAYFRRFTGDLLLYRRNDACSRRRIRIGELDRQRIARINFHFQRFLVRLRMCGCSRICSQRNCDHILCIAVFHIGIPVCLVRYDLGDPVCKRRSSVAGFIEDIRLRIRDLVECNRTVCLIALLLDFGPLLSVFLLQLECEFSSLKRTADQFFLCFRCPCAFVQRSVQNFNLIKFRLLRGRRQFQNPCLVLRSIDRHGCFFHDRAFGSSRSAQIVKRISCCRCGFNNNVFLQEVEILKRDLSVCIRCLGTDKIGIRQRCVLCFILFKGTVNIECRALDRSVFLRYCIQFVQFKITDQYETDILTLICQLRITQIERQCVVLSACFFTARCTCTLHEVAVQCIRRCTERIRIIRQIMPCAQCCQPDDGIQLGNVSFADLSTQ